MLCASLATGGCQVIGEAKIVRRVLDDHRTRARVKPLSAAGVIHIALSRREDPAASGTEVLDWDAEHFRETVSSAGLTRVRGIQGRKAFFTDEDYVTRVASEPVLADLVTRSYFWRRAYLFDDLERAHPVLGPSDAASVSIGLTPRGGNTLWLVFARSDGRLLRAHSLHFDLSFETERASGMGPAAMFPFGAKSLTSGCRLAPCSTWPRADGHLNGKNPSPSRR